MLQGVDAELLRALVDNSPNAASHLDREGGEVILIPGDVFSPGGEE